MPTETRIRALQHEPLGEGETRRLTRTDARIAPGHRDHSVP